MERTDPEDVGLSAERLGRIDRHLLERYVEPGKVAGVLTVVARGGKIAHFSTLGSADIERGVPVRDDTIFRIYSMTKPVTSVAAMMLFERGVFQLHDPVHRWIPSFRDLGVYRYGKHPAFVTEPAARPMTVHDLLTHQSGLTYGFMERTGVDAAYRRLHLLRGEGTLEDFVETLATVPLEFSPGSAWNYSVSTDVLGRLVEIWSGESLDEHFRRHIFEPLGMTDTGFTVPENARDRLSACYTRDADRRLALIDDPADSAYCRPKTLFAGGSGLVSTASDYLRFSEMLRRGGEIDGARLLGPRTIRYMTQNHLPGGADLAGRALGSFSETRYEGVGFGLGFSVTIDPVRAQVPSSVGEYGWGGMASTAFWIDPAEELVVVFMTQLIPSSTFNFRGQLKQLVYAALV